jgi:pimeloyl-ACP methyl ester carboxylesterase
MPAVAHAATSSSSGLIVLLPGFGDGPEDYESNGFVEMIQQANPGYEVIAADAHFGYYRNFSVVERLHQDVIAPALSREKRSVWLVGISMGGLGAATYAMEHEDLVKGVILLAPYMGDSDVIEEVKLAGGLAKWSPPEKWREIEDAETRKYYQLWSWYQEFATSPETQPQLFIGHGLDDGLGGPNDLVARVLPDDHSETMPGGHKWKVWKQLFAKLVRRALTE